MKLKYLGAAAVLTCMSGVASAALIISVAEQGVSVELSRQSSGSLPTFAYQELSVSSSGLTWDCSTGACSLGDGARLDVVLSSAEGARAVQTQEPWGTFSLAVTVSEQGLSVLDPLGASWTLLPDLAVWQYGVHIAENVQPDDAQFVVSYGSLQLAPFQLANYSPYPVPALGTTYQVSITDQAGWVEAGPTDSVARLVPTSDVPAFSAWTFLSSMQQPQIIAPVYALPSLNPSCMSTTCMRYERGTLMIDAHRLSFGVQAVAAVPEPSTWAFMALGLLALGVFARDRADV